MKDLLTIEELEERDYALMRKIQKVGLILEREMRGFEPWQMGGPSARALRRLHKDLMSDLVAIRTSKALLVKDKLSCAGISMEDVLPKRCNGMIQARWHGKKYHTCAKAASVTFNIYNGGHSW